VPKKSPEADFSRQSRKKSQIATLATDSAIPAFLFPLNVLHISVPFSKETCAAQ